MKVVRYFEFDGSSGTKVLCLVNCDIMDIRLALSGPLADISLLGVRPASDDASMSMVTRKGFAVASITAPQSCSKKTK